MEEIEGFRYRCRVSGPQSEEQHLIPWPMKLLMFSTLFHLKWLKCAVSTDFVSMQDAMRSVTKQAVKEARLKEIKQELLNSEKLKVSCSNLRGLERVKKINR